MGNHSVITDYLIFILGTANIYISLYSTFSLHFYNVKKIKLCLHFVLHY